MAPTAEGDNWGRTTPPLSPLRRGPPAGLPGQGGIQQPLWALVGEDGPQNCSRQGAVQAGVGGGRCQWVYSWLLVTGRRFSRGMADCRDASQSGGVLVPAALTRAQCSRVTLPLESGSKGRGGEWGSQGEQGEVLPVTLEGCTSGVVHLEGRGQAMSPMKEGWMRG